MWFCRPPEVFDGNMAVSASVVRMRKGGDQSMAVTKFRKSPRIPIARVTSQRMYAPNLETRPKRQKKAPSSLQCVLNDCYDHSQTSNVTKLYCYPTPVYQINT